MLVLRSRHRRAGGSLRFDPSLTLILLLSMLVAGCGERKGYAPTADARVAAPPQAQFRATLADRQVELEADGLPVQRAPLLRRTRMPDDPSEPFSPNYGGPPPMANERSARDDAAARAQVRQAAAHAAIRSEQPVVQVSVRDLPEDLPPDFRERLIVSSVLR